MSTSRRNSRGRSCAPTASHRNSSACIESSDGAERSEGLPRIAEPSLGALQPCLPRLDERDPQAMYAVSHASPWRSTMSCHRPHVLLEPGDRRRSEGGAANRAWPARGYRIAERKELLGSRRRTDRTGAARRSRARTHRRRIASPPRGSGGERVVQRFQSPQVGLGAAHAYTSLHGDARLRPYRRRRRALRDDEPPMRRVWKHAGAESLEVLPAFVMSKRGRLSSLRVISISSGPSLPAPASPPSRPRCARASTPAIGCPGPGIVDPD